jgi:hypothetical protein
MKEITKIITPATSFIGLPKVISEIPKKVNNPAAAEERRIFAEEIQFKETPNFFLMNRRLKKKLGRPKIVDVAIKPMIPN